MPARGRSTDSRPPGSPLLAAASELPIGTCSIGTVGPAGGRAGSASEQLQGHFLAGPWPSHRPPKGGLTELGDTVVGAHPPQCRGLPWAASRQPLEARAQSVAICHGVGVPVPAPPGRPPGTERRGSGVPGWGLRVLSEPPYSPSCPPTSTLPQSVMWKHPSSPPRSFWFPPPHP